MILIPSDISTNLPSIAVQEGVISAGLNASMVQDVLAGIYTMIYSGAVYFHITRKKPDRRIVVWSITLMYILSMMTFIIEWWWLDQWMVDDGATRQTMFLANIEGPPQSVFVFNNFVIYLSFLVAEAFLIWQSFKFYEMSVRLIVVPSIICVAQFCLLFASVALSSLARGGHPENLHLAQQYNNVISAFVFASLVTTIITTVLVGKKVEVTATLLTASKFKRTLGYVVTLLLESGVIAVAMLLFVAVLSVMPQSYRLGSTELILSYYGHSISSIFMGMSPTLLILSLALKTAATGPKQAAVATSKIVSELRFGSAPGVPGRSHRSTNLSLQIVSVSQGNGQPDILGTGFKGRELEGIPETEKV